MQKTFIVTGATSGIGLATAEQLAGMGAQVLGVGRSADRCEAAEKRIRQAHPGAAVHYLLADLSLQEEVRMLARQVEAVLVHQGLAGLDGLVNDAGIYSWKRKLTPEGFERVWAVNHLAPFLLTNELLPLLQAAESARVVTVSSNASAKAYLRWKDLQMVHGYFGMRMYGQTKLCNVLFTAELRRRLGKDSRVRAFAADPGFVHTGIGLKGNGGLVYWFWDRWSRRGITPEESAKGLVFLATEPSIGDSTEIYWRHSHPKAPNPLALDAEEGRKLWEISAEMCGI